MSTVEMLNLDKMLNDLLDILASLEGRVKRIELKKSIKKRPSYMKVVGEEEPVKSVTDAVRIEQTQHSLELITAAVARISDRITVLEKD